MASPARLFYGSLLLAIIGAGVGGAWFASRSPTLLIAEPTRAEFDAVEGEMVSATFVLRNVSSEPVRILGAPTSCGCTVVSESFPINLGPGESTSLTVEMAVGKPDSKGIFSQQTFLFVNRAGTVPTLVTEAFVH